MRDVAASVEMLIQKPARTVFDAFVNPRTLEAFWLKSASGPLASNATVEWEFMVPGARDTVNVTAFVPDSSIVVEWSDGIVAAFKFEQVDAGSTRLSISATGFQGADAHAHAMNATEGFAIVACDLKCLLETGRSGNMVRDKAVLIHADSRNTEEGR